MQFPIQCEGQYQDYHHFLLRCETDLAMVLLAAPGMAMATTRAIIAAASDDGESGITQNPGFGSPIEKWVEGK